MKGVQFLVAFVLLALASKLVSASDPGPLQDFCVAINDTKDGVFVNGKFCKDPKLATAEDFFLPGLNIPGNTSNQVGSMVTPANFPAHSRCIISYSRHRELPRGMKEWLDKVWWFKLSRREGGLSVSQDLVL
ncbi:hypothetical protein GOBAR_AA14776 [Gossypium barbadense]|uniref:Cupin type-1 domain-containing protein n=1 Tax=Gossypium barbadense TaxID=3634 RepID=A0A2P5XRA1_GOSBA|nr:hypothetical protein GOBAR_AA14776 [Gossypium barbadense]